MVKIFERGSNEYDRLLPRSLIYRFLARSFSYPGRDYVSALNNDTLLDCFNEWQLLGIDASDEKSRIINWLKVFDQEEVLKELQIDYTRMLINHYPKILVAPYSSVYLDKDAKVWGPSTAKAARLYQAAGLYMRKDFNEVPDHIAAELEFASYLISEQLKQEKDRAMSSDKLHKIEREFIFDHLLKWAPSFFYQIIEKASTPFYQQMASLSSKFLDFEASQ